MSATFCSELVSNLFFLSDRRDQLFLHFPTGRIKPSKRDYKVPLDRLYIIYIFYIYLSLYVLYIYIYIQVDDCPTV